MKLTHSMFDIVYERLELEKELVMAHRLLVKDHYGLYTVTDVNDELRYYSEKVDMLCKLFDDLKKVIDDEKGLLELSSLEKF